MAGKTGVRSQLLLILENAVIRPQLFVEVL